MSDKKQKNQVTRARMAGAYLTSVISISLVLLLIGFAALLLANASSVSRYFKESLQVTVMLQDGASEDDAALYASKVSSLPYVKNARIVTREEGERELAQMLGEDFLSVFESSPVPISVELSLKAEYVEPDSLKFVTSTLQAASPLVDEVSCQQSLVEALNANMTRISLVLGVFVLALLVISFALISNTVRISLHAQRFSIHTMKLVGATLSFIRAPFLLLSVLQCFVSSLLALAVLAAGLNVMRTSFPALFSIIDLRATAIAGAAVVVSGVLICLVSTFFVVTRLVNTTRDNLYV